MKSIQLMLTSRWTQLLAVLFIAVWCTRVDAAYWNRNRTQTHRTGADLDGDGIPNIVDLDIDNDGITNSLDRNIDGGIAKSGFNQGKYLGDREDNDSPSEEDIDADGLADDSLAEKDTDSDGDLNDDASEDDIDGDGRADDSSAERDIDGDGRNDDSAQEDDIDGDGRDDDDPLELDIDGDGRSNSDIADTDIDGDGRLNDDFTETDDDGDEVADVHDADDNNNSVKDIDEPNHHPESGEQEIQAELVAQPAAPQVSSVQITLQHYGTGSAKFEVDARDLAVGNYELLVGGVMRGTLVVVQESNKAVLVFKSAESGSGDLLLDFPVAEQSIELRQAATVYFSGIAPPLPPIGSGDEGANSVTLTRGAGISNLAQIEVQFHFGSSSPTQLEINLQKVPAGDYSVVIGNVPRGTLTVIGSVGESEGQLNFEVGGSGSNLPLNFPSAGQMIQIVQGSTVYFFGQLPAAAAAP